MSHWQPASAEAAQLLRLLPRHGFLLHHVPDQDDSGPWALHYTRHQQCTHVGLILDSIIVHSDYLAWAYRTSLTGIDTDHPWNAHPPALWRRGGSLLSVVPALLSLPLTPPAHDLTALADLDTDQHARPHRVPSPTHNHRQRHEPTSTDGSPP